MTLTAVDLFCGAGGLSLGLEEAGFATVMALDNDQDACATFRRALPHVELIQKNAQLLSFKPWRGVDLVAGGPPCQPFSTGGLGRGNFDCRDMLPVFVRAVLDINPRAFLLENVPGLVSSMHQGYLAEVLAPLFDHFRVIGPMVINAADFGVPQSRRRLVMIGMRDIVPIALDGSPQARIPAGLVLREEPLGQPNLSKIVYARTPDLRPDPYHGQLFNGGGRAIKLDRPAPTVLASAGGNKTHFLDLGRHVPPYHRHLMSGGMPRQGELPEARRLTVAESALLQTFPSEMHFAGPRSSQYAQIGNAVPPRLAAALGMAVADGLYRVKSRAYAA